MKGLRFHHANNRTRFPYPKIHNYPQRFFLARQRFALLFRSGSLSVIFYKFAKPSRPMTYFFKSTKSLLIIMLIVASLSLVSCKTQQAGLHPSDNNNANQNKTGRESKKISEVISTARSYIGTKYQYGGCSRSGID